MFKKSGDWRYFFIAIHLLNKGNRSLRLLSRDVDFVGELGGDKFAVFLVDCDEIVSLWIVK